MQLTRYRGVPFANLTHGIINVTGIDEGVAFGPAFRSEEEPLQYESVLSRTIKAKFTGARARGKAKPQPRLRRAPASAAAPGPARRTEQMESSWSVKTPSP